MIVNSIQLDERSESFAGQSVLYLSLIELDNPWSLSTAGDGGQL